MPASLFSEMERGGSGLQDERALQLALELSMLGLSSEGNNDGGPLGSHAAPTAVPSPSVTVAPGFDSDEPRIKKSQNMTECVPVPSSEHVAEIVGRQGCKIKALRAKTNTYIKTPVRGEEPVFVVTGRKEDVTLAKREILSAAEHFSQIRASRKNTNGSMAPGPPNPTVPGQSTIQVRVPYRVVGLVVGPKGATIKRIQQQTHTYIVTPSRDKEPVFEVTGLPENVETARREIEAHIAMRTGTGMMDGLPVDDANDFHTNGIESSTISEPATPNNLVNSMYKGFGAFQNGSNNLFFSTSSSTTDSTNIFSYPSATVTSTSPTKLPDFTSSVFGGNSYDTDEGISESPTFDPLSLWSEFSSKERPRLGSMSGSSVIGSKMQRSYSVPDTHPQSLTPDELDPSSQVDRLPARRIRSAPLAIVDDQPITQENNTGAPPAVSGANVLINGFGSSTSSSSAAGSASSSPIDSSLGSIGTGIVVPPRKRDCMVCFESSVVSALVPCGHNLFCMECAQRLCEKSDPICPVCHQPITQAIRIYS